MGRKVQRGWDICRKPSKNCTEIMVGACRCKRNMSVKAYKYWDEGCKRLVRCVSLQLAYLHQGQAGKYNEPLQVQQTAEGDKTAQYTGIFPHTTPAYQETYTLQVHQVCTYHALVGQSVSWTTVVKVRTLSANNTIAETEASVEVSPTCQKQKPKSMQSACCDCSDTPH